jgi:hypothetical protein
LRRAYKHLFLLILPKNEGPRALETAIVNEQEHISTDC